MKKRTLRNLTVVGLLASLLLTLLPLASASASTSCWSLFESERLLKRATNRSRMNHGLDALPLDQDLSKVARRHSERMADAGEPYHTGSATFQRLLTGGWTSVHENVGMAYADSSSLATDIRDLQASFMRSPTHRQNILTRGSDYLGIGVVRRNGKLFVTVLLVEGGNPDTTLRVPTC